MRLSKYDAVMDAYRARWPITKIMKRFRIGKSTIMRYVRAAGIEKNRRRLPSETRDRIIKDYRAGVLIAIIARRYGVSEGYVSGAARVAGISRGAGAHNRHRGN